MDAGRVLIALTLAVAAAPTLAAMRPAAATKAEAPRDYAVVVSRKTAGDADWKRVVDLLVRRHRARQITYGGEVNDSLVELKRQFPRYACFVAQPSEAGRQFVVDVSRLTRKLDDDPYTDALWGIVTGCSPADALRIAANEGPLLIRQAGAGTGLNLDLFRSGKAFSEGTAGEYWEKTPDGKAEKKSGPVDSTKPIVDFLNDESPDLFITSGHATENDWQIGYSYKNGQLRCREGKLVGVDLKGKSYAIHSPNPKVFLGAGNCLIGHIRDRNSMILGWLGSGGANQAVGYTVSTWYGAMGWGTKDYLLDLPGRYTAAESFFFTNQAIIHQLHKRFPQAADVELDRFDLETSRGLIGRYAGQLGYRQWDETAKDHLGMLWDRDTVAFYGDPAYEARLAPRELPLTTELTEKAGTLTFTIRVKEACKPARPLAMLLPKRLPAVQIVSGQEHEPLITDSFLMLTKVQAFEAGKTYQVVFRAKVR